MNSEDYWKDRAAWNMYHYMDEAEKTADLIAKVYRRASMWLSFEAADIFEKYMTKHKLSENEARRLLNSLYDKTSLEELLRKLKEGDGETSKAELLKELEAPAYQARLERLRQIQNQLDWIMKNIYLQEKDFSTAFYTDLGNEAYYRSIFEIQKQAGFAFSFNHVSEKQIDRVLNMNWSGKHYSARIWSNTQALSKDIKEELLISLITGRTERETAEVLANKFGQGAMQARRLVRTEGSFVSAELQGMARRECGIGRYQFIATLDLKTSRICREMDGRIFYEKDRMPGVNCNPMHPWCRSTTLSVLDGVDLEKMTRTFRDPVTGKKVRIPRNMNYEEWYKKYVEKAPDSDIIKLKDTIIRKSAGAKAKNYDILDPETGEYFHFAEGTRIQNSQAFAGKGTRTPLHEGVAEGLAKQIGGTPSKWQHCKGDGVIDYHGEERPAEVHWFQEETVGKHKFKIKHWLE